MSETTTSRPMITPAQMSMFFIQPFWFEPGS